MSLIGRLQLVKLTIIIGFLILSINFVSAFAISTPNWDTSPLNLYPGEKRIVPISLQNMAPADKDDLVVEIQISSEIANIVTGQTVYDLPYGSEIKVPIEVTMPKDANLGDTYDVMVNAKSSTKAEISRGVGMNVALVVKFPVIAVEKKPETAGAVKESPNLNLASALMLLILIIIIVAVIHRRYSKKEGKKK